MPKVKGYDVYWYIPNKKRPFFGSTTATKDLIDILYEQYKDCGDSVEIWAKIWENIHYDSDAKKIAKVYKDYFEKEKNQ